MNDDLRSVLDLLIKKDYYEAELVADKLLAGNETAEMKIVLQYLLSIAYKMTERINAHNNALNSFLKDAVLQTYLDYSKVKTLSEWGMNRSELNVDEYFYIKNYSYPANQAKLAGPALHSAFGIILTECIPYLISK